MNRSRVFLIAALLPAFLPFQCWAQSLPEHNGGDFSSNTAPKTKVPKGVILVKGAWAGASDSTTPVPENAGIANGVFTDKYFGLSYPLPANWMQKYTGPPPSDTGRYVLAQLRPIASLRDKLRANILITAQDMFFAPEPVANALQLVNFTKEHLQAGYKLELPPANTTIGGRPFRFFAYWSPVAELHWYVLATEIRCHAIEIVMTSADTQALANLLLQMNSMKLPAEASPTGGNGGGEFPACIKDYANGENVIQRVAPVFTEHRFNAVPVRIIIGKDGVVKHIHFLSAFPDQTKAISDALKQWRFRPYLRNGRAQEVETGLMFGRAPLYRMAKRREAATQ